jgi:hypothetical protein
MEERVELPAAAEFERRCVNASALRSRGGRPLKIPVMAATIEKFREFYL